MKLPRKQSRGTESGATALADHFFHDHGRLKPYRKDEEIYAAGDPAGHVYLISSGDVKTSRFTPDGRELILDNPGPGTLFGESEILLDKTRESQATARTATLAYELEQARLMKFVRDRHGVALWLTRRMGIRQARMEDRLESLFFKSATGKVAQLLLNLARNHGRKTREGTLIDYSITHQEIGSLIATSRETVSYAFMDFREQGLISTQKRKTIVHDLPGLGKVALN